MSTKYSTSSQASSVNSALSSLVGQENAFWNHPVAEFTHSKLGGVAKYICVVQNSEQLCGACKIALENRLPYQVIGQGTGSLVSEFGYEGLIIFNHSQSIFFMDESRQVVVESGALNSKLVLSAASRSFGGQEFLISIPGSVGGAIASSACFDGKTLQRRGLKEIVIFSPSTNGGEVVTVPLENIPDQPYRPLWDYEVGFQPVILTARFQLAKLTQREILNRISSYQSMQNIDEARPGFDYVFAPPLQKAFVEAKLPTPPNNTRLQRKNTNLIELQAGKTAIPSDIRRYLTEIQKIISNSGVDLEVRLSFLGYWPKDNEAFSADPQSI